MASQGNNFDSQSIKRIAATVYNYERTRGATNAGTAPGPVAPSASFWAMLGQESTSDPGAYKWTKQWIINGHMVRGQGNDQTNFTAREANGQTGLSNKIVLLTFCGYDDDQKASYVFECPSSLPQPGSARMVLQLDGNLKPVWDWVKVP